VALLKHPTQPLVTVPCDEILKDERLLESGVSSGSPSSVSQPPSLELAESEADHHLAAALASAGCPLELLRQIVL
jgi:hypothetical protein